MSTNVDDTSHSETGDTATGDNNSFESTYFEPASVESTKSSGESGNEGSDEDEPDLSPEEDVLVDRLSQEDGTEGEAFGDVVELPDDVGDDESSAGARSGLDKSPYR